MNKQVNKEQEDLVVKNMRLVPYILKTLGIQNSNCNYEDYIQAGYIGLIKASRTFDYNHKTKFATYASTCIRNEIFMCLRKEKKNQKNIYLQDTMNLDADDSALTIEETIEDKKAEFIEGILNCETLEKVLMVILNCMDSRKRKIILYNISEMSQSEISKRANISQSYVSRLEKKIRNELKFKMKENLRYDKRYEVKIDIENDSIIFIINNIQRYGLNSEDIIFDIKSINTDSKISLRCKNNQLIIKLSIDFISFYNIAQIIELIEDLN